jgi:RHS repeat-associated protein
MGGVGNNVLAYTDTVMDTMTCDTTQNGFALTNTYIIGPSGEQLTETDGNGNWVHTNVFAAGQLLATYSYTDNSHAATDTYFALSDWLGTKRAVVSAGGCGTGYVGLPYGDSLTATNLPGFTQCPDATEHHFTGKERDAESGNDYFGARYYASSMGRWMSPDWSAKVEPVPYACPSFFSHVITGDALA